MTMAMISRQEAAEVLMRLEQSGSLPEDIEGALAEIRARIAAAESSLHLWGAGDDHVKLVTAYREDLYTEDLTRELAGIETKYEFVPSPFEAAGI